MEQSKWPISLSRKGYYPDSTQWNRLRFASIDELVEGDFPEQLSVRHPDSKQTARAEQREWAFIRSVGRKTGMSED